MIYRLFRNYRDQIILVFIPILFFLTNSNWIFTPATNYMPDPWFYLGYFRYFYDYAPVYPSKYLYYVERLTWNVPGYYIYNFFPPLLANYILHLIVYYIAIYSLYGIIRLLFGYRAAIMGAILLGCYPWFLRAAGWDYPDGAGIAHMLLVIYLLTLAIHSNNWKGYILGAGVIHTSLLIINPFWIGFFPSWGLFFLYLNYQKKKFDLHKLILASTYFILGSLLTVIIVGIFYFWATGNYFFLENTIKSSISLTHDVANKNAVITNYGHLKPFWHIVPLIIWLISTLRIAVCAYKKDVTYYTSLPTYVMFVVAYGWLIFWHFYSVPFLIVFPYSSFAIPATFIQLGALISSTLKKFSQTQFYYLSLITIGLFILPSTILIAIPAAEELQGNIILILCCTLILLIAQFISKRRIAITISIIAISWLYYFISINSYVYLSNRSLGKDNFLSIISASQTIDSHYPGHIYKQFRLWFREDRNYDTFFSLAGLYLYPWGSAIGDPYSSKKPPAELSILSREQVHEDDNIVIVSSESDYKELISEANRVLLPQEIKLVITDSEIIQQGSISFYLYFTKATTIDSQY